MGNIVEFRHIDAGYGRIQILSDLSFEVEEGQVYGVIGPNGSGKSTMFNALLGIIRPTAGAIYFDNIDITRTPPHIRCRMGIGRTFQIPRPFEHMSVYENVLIAAVHGTGQSEKKAGYAAIDALKLTGLYEKRELLSGELPLLDRKRLEVARAIGTQPKLLLLDEVAAGLTDAEVKDMMKLVKGLKDSGYSIIWIEHIIQTMLGSTDRLMCMAQGSSVIEGEPQEVINSKTVQTLYLGVDDNE
ncbi:MAG: ABC transporter ATP-binding protein [Ruminococcus sp.]|nr:ABC transporter ATP-binding protein [Ruminococcus sp.]